MTSGIGDKFSTARDNLVAAIKKYDSGLAFNQLAKDLERRDRVCVISYADLAAFEQLLGKQTINMVETPARRMPLFVEIHGALQSALEAGVLVTRDFTKEIPSRSL